jgi:hypothetical protein
LNFIIFFIILTYIIMYITLNSATEANDANFTNFISDTITIEPNSFICLNGAGFQTHDNSYDLGQIDTFEFRVAFQYTGVTQVYTFPAGDYTLQSFCDTWNALVLDASPYYRFHLNPQDTAAAGLIVQIQMYRKEPPGTDRNPAWWSNYYLEQIDRRICPLIGQSNITVPLQEPALLSGAAATIGADRIQMVNGLVANNYDFVAGARMPSQFLGPATPFDWYKEPGEIMDRYTFETSRLTHGAITYCMADGGKYGDFYLEGVDVNYDSTQEQLRAIDQASLALHYLLRIQHANTGIATLTMRKTDGTLHTWPTRNFNPGDTYKISLNPRWRADGTYDMVVEQMSNTLRMNAWLPLDPTEVSPASYDAGSTSIPILLQDQLGWQTDYPCGEAEYTLYDTGDHKMGCRFGCASERQVTLPATAVEVATSIETNPAAPAAERKVFTALGNGDSTIMPETNAIYLSRFATILTNTQTNQCVRIGDGSGGQGFESVLPTAYTMCFKLENDTAFGGGSNNHVIFGGVDTTAGSVDLAVVVIGSASIKIDDWNAGTVTLNPLVSGTGAPFPGWAYDVGYCLTIGCAGTQNQAISVNITDENNNWYAAVGNTSGANGRLPNLTHIGARYDPNINPANQNYRMNGYVWDFRMSQQNLGEAIPTSFTHWVNIHNNIAQWSVVTGNLGIVKGADWYYNFNDRVDWTPEDGRDNAGLEIVSVSRLYPNMRVGPLWQKLDGALPAQVNWNHLGNLTLIPHVTTTRGTILEAGNLGNPVTQALTTYTFTVATDTANAITNSMVQGVVGIPSIELLPIRHAVAPDEYASAGMPWTDHTEILMPFAVYNGGQVAGGVDVREQVYNICIENLPHRTINGRTNNISKSIYEILHNETHNTFKGDTELINFIPRHKIWIPLRNAGEIPINSLHVKIADAAMREVQDLVGDTHIHIEIASKDEIFS